MREWWVAAVVILSVTAPGLAADPLISPPISIDGGTVHITCPAERLEEVPQVLIHFHGAVSTTSQNFHTAGLPGFLVTVNFPGLSSAYANPFRALPDLFDRILNVARDQAARLTRSEQWEEWGPIYLSSFSAGYGAVREILKSSQDFRRVRGLVTADSIYASLAEGTAKRAAHPEQMRDFRRFAALACQSQKSFVVTHCYLETPYASTFETADDLLAFVQIQREPPKQGDTPPLVQRNWAHRGRFTVLGYEGNDGEAHLQHLRHIGRWWKMLEP